MLKAICVMELPQNLVIKDKEHQLFLKLRIFQCKRNVLFSVDLFQSLDI